MHPVTRLFTRLAAVLAPVALLYAVPAAILYRTGEFTSLDRVIQGQRTGDRLVLYGPAYSNRALAYKLRAVLARRPKVIALGTSRVMQFRSPAFREPDVFFNAGGGIRRLWDARIFLDRLPPGREPRVILLGLDSFFFNRAWPDFGPGQPEYDDDLSNADLLLAEQNAVYADLFGGKFGWADLTAPRRADTTPIGLNALVRNNGFRNDGSYYYGSYLQDPFSPQNEDFEFRHTLWLIEHGANRFEWSDAVASEALRELDLLLAACRQRNIHVVGFLPPFSHTIYEALRARPDRYGYVLNLAAAVAPVFARHGLPCHDFSDLADLGFDDTATIDGFHATEPVYLHMLLTMARDDDTLRPFLADEARLRERLERRPNPYLVFGNAEF
jgi:hypothetical protein